MTPINISFAYISGTLFFPFSYYFIVVSCLFFCYLSCYPRLDFLCNQGYPESFLIDEAGTELREPPASVSQMLVLKEYVTFSRLLPVSLENIY